jgi:hypothetical protein
MRGDLFQDRGWREGIFATEWTMPVPANAAPALYRLDVNVIQSRYAYRAPIMNWAEEKVERMLLGPVKLAVSPPAPSELQAARPADVRWGDQIALLGYNIGSGRVRADEALVLTFYWQALAKPTRDYTVFVHLLDAAGKLCAQIDAQPRGGAYPTSVWDAGEIVCDDYVLTLPGDLTPGAYRIEIGFYEYPSLARLNVTDANDQVQGDHWALPDSIQVVR